MRALMICLMMLSLSGCVTGPSGEAVCDGTRAMRAAHAGALVEDGGPRSRRTGAQLIAVMDAGCGSG